MIKIIKKAIEFELITYGEKLPSGDYMRAETIEVALDWNGKLTILTHMLKPIFQFDESDPVRVERIGKLLVEASKLAIKHYDFLDKSENVEAKN